MAASTMSSIVKRPWDDTPIVMLRRSKNCPNIIIIIIIIIIIYLLFFYYYFFFFCIIIHFIFIKLQIIDISSVQRLKPAGR